MTTFCYTLEMKLLKRKREKEPPRCPVCGREQQLETISLLRGSHGKIELFFSQLPTLTCGQADHPRRFAGNNFGAQLIDAVFWHKNVPMAKKGVWSKIKCIQCGKGVAKEPTYLGEVGGQLKIKDLPPFTIRISGPMISCPRCETEQLAATRAIGTDVSNGFIDAFQRIDLGP